MSVTPSKKFESWDSNLMTEWHARYVGAGHRAP
jgi:hypothetical protein